MCVDLVLEAHHLLKLQKKKLWSPTHTGPVSQGALPVLKDFVAL